MFGEESLEAPFLDGCRLGVVYFEVKKTSFAYTELFCKRARSKFILKPIYAEL